MDEARVEIDLRVRERRLYDRLRARVVTHDPGGGSGALDVALLLPDLATLLYRLMRDPRVPTRFKAIALVGLGYVLSPIDVLPALLLGPLGALDDVVVVAAALSRIVNHVHPDIVRDHWSGRDDALEVIRRITTWCDSLLGRTFTRILGFRPIR